MAFVIDFVLKSFCLTWVLLPLFSCHFHLHDTFFSISSLSVSVCLCLWSESLSISIYIHIHIHICISYFGGVVCFYPTIHPMHMSIDFKMIIDKYIHITILLFVVFLCDFSPGIRVWDLVVQLLSETQSASDLFPG